MSLGLQSFGRVGPPRWLIEKVWGLEHAFERARASGKVEDDTRLRIFFLLFKHIDESVKVLKLVPDAHVLTIDVSTPARLVRDTWRFMREARRLQIDTVINLEMFARFSTILTYLTEGIR